MERTLNLPEIERIEFFNGQRLIANDLQSLDEFNREMRWLHNRSLHTWGIANGFEVSAEVGDRKVKISPGYALDSSGREIVLLEEKIKPLPPVAGDNDRPISYYLTVNFPSEEDLERTETREKSCSLTGARGAVRRRAQPVFCWVRLRPIEDSPTVGKGDAQNGEHGKQIADGDKIVLGQFDVKNCQLKLPLSLKPRRGARPSLKPFIACGTTEKGNTKWELWQVDIGSHEREDKRVLGIQVRVDTASARFKVTPCYNAYIAGKRVIPPNELQQFPELNFAKPLVMDGFAFVQTDADEQERRPSPNHFWLRVLLPHFFFSNDVARLETVQSLFNHVMFSEPSIATTLITAIANDETLGNVTIPNDQNLINTLTGKVDQDIQKWSDALSLDLSEKLQLFVTENPADGLAFPVDSVSAVKDVFSQTLKNAALPTPVLAPASQTIEMNPREIVQENVQENKKILIELLRDVAQWHVVWTGVEE